MMGQNLNGAILMMDKYAARQVKTEVGRVLWEVWDPIGVNDEPNARDEYSGYVNGVFELLTSAATHEDIAEHLREIAIQRMGLPRLELADTSPTVSALRAIRLPK
jgi:hypothetical protein